MAVEYLEALRFFRDDAESWESTLLADPDVDARDEQYAIAMARHLHPASDISTWSHEVALGALRHLAGAATPISSGGETACARLRPNPETLR